MAFFIKQNGGDKMGGAFSSCSCELEAGGQVGENVKGEIDLKVEINGKEETKKEEEKND